MTVAVCRSKNLPLSTANSEEKKAEDIPKIMPLIYYIYHTVFYYLNKVVFIYYYSLINIAMMSREHVFF